MDARNNGRLNLDPIKATKRNGYPRHLNSSSNEVEDFSTDVGNGNNIKGSYTSQSSSQVLNSDANNG